MQWLLPIALFLIVVGYEYLTHTLAIHAEITPRFLIDTLLFGVLGPVVVWVALAWVAQGVAQREAAEAKLAQRNRELTALYAVATTINHSPIDLNVLLNRLLDIVQDSLGFDGCSILLADGKGGLRFAAARGLDADLPGMKGLELSFTHPAVQRLARSREPVYIAAPFPPQPQAHPRFLSIPLWARERLVGAMNVHRDGVSTLADEEVALLSTLGAEAAVAIENAQLYEEARRADTLSALIQEMHHRIKNNLQTVSDLLSLEMSRGGSVSAQESLRDSIGRIKSIAAVHELLSIEQPKLTDIAQLARLVSENAVHSMVSRDRDIQVAVHGPSIYLPSKQATALALVLNELISNAVQHGLKDMARGQVIVALDQQEDEVWIRVQNNGRGLPPGFDLNRSRGLGLQIAKTLVEKDLGGTLDIVDDEGRGVIAIVRFRK